MSRTTRRGTTLAPALTSRRARPAEARITRALVVGAIAALTIAFVAGALDDPSSPLARGLPVAVMAAAVISLLVRATSVRTGGSAWAVLALAVAVWMAGAVADAATGAPPAVADGVGAVCRVAFYPLAYLGLVQLVRGRIRHFAAGLWLDGLIGALAVSAVGVGVLVQSPGDAGAGVGDLVLRLVLPLGDLLLLAFIAGIMALNGWRPSRAWILIGAGLALMAIAHAVELTFTPGDHGGYELTQLLGPVGIGLIGLSAWWPWTLSPQLRREGWGLMMGPTLFGWLTVVLVAYANLVEFGAAGLALATMTLMLVMARTGLTLRENVAIAQELRAEIAQSTRDALTGLWTHRVFQESLTEAVTTAQAHAGDLSLVIVDIDDFRLVNERFGHEAGDSALRQIAEAIVNRLRADDRVARIGGEEFACILPDTDGTAALAVAERIRAMIEAFEFPGIGRLTLSAGVCDLRRAASAADILRLADGALYWAKTHGRNRVARYEPDVMDVLSAEERAARAERARTLSALSALARAIDAKDTSTQLHSERVGAIAAAIAARLGWSPEEARLLQEAALVHDVGKIGVPDRILTKPGALEREEYEVMMSHAALGARIVSDVLTPEQATWILHHHERWDGRGYPTGIGGEAIPRGALIMAVADAWDAMTAHREYRRAMSGDAAVLVLRDGAGSQWWSVAVDAAIALYERGQLSPSSTPGDHDAAAVTPSVVDFELRHDDWGVQVDAVAAGELQAASVANGATNGDRVEAAVDQRLA